jgi:hypothetical protein
MAPKAPDCQEQTQEMRYPLQFNVYSVVSVELSFYSRLTTATWAQRVSLRTARPLMYEPDETT